MNDNTIKGLYDKFGHSRQLNKLQEELLELALVLNQITCSTKDPLVMTDKLYDELADVKIMMRQAELYLFDQARINNRVDQKLEMARDKYLK